MVARIYKPARTAMQSGTAKTKDWVLDYEPEAPPEVEPLMGWTSSADMKQELRLRFHTKEEAIAYCERNGAADCRMPIISPSGGACPGRISPARLRGRDPGRSPDGAAPSRRAIRESCPRITLRFIRVTVLFVRTAAADCPKYPRPRSSAG